MPGDYCEVDINECETKTAECYNDAACVNEPGTYSCNCSLGYIGRHCNTANCSLSQCINSGTCLIGNNGRWSCECPEFYTGMSAFLSLLYCCLYSPKSATVTLWIIINEIYIALIRSPSHVTVDSWINEKHIQVHPKDVCEHSSSDRLFHINSEVSFAIGGLHT